MAVKRIVNRQGKLNNALVDNQLDYPIRAEFDDIDLADLFSPVALLGAIDPSPTPSPSSPSPSLSPSRPPCSRQRPWRTTCWTRTPRWTRPPR